MDASPSVFISYEGEDHRTRERVLDLADQLESVGIQVFLDQYEPYPAGGWTAWTLDNLTRAKFVLCVLTSDYASSESFRLVSSWLSTFSSEPLQKVLAIIFDEPGPPFYEAERFYIREVRLTDQGFERLYRVLTNQPRAPRPSRGQLVRLDERSKEDSSGAVNLPPVKVPDDLVTALGFNDCVAFVGSGIAARAGYPTWGELVENLLGRAVSEGVMSPAHLAAQLAALRNGGVNAAADNVVSAFGDRDRVLRLYRQTNVGDGSLPKAYGLLRELPFSAILTSNYDDLLNTALQGTDYEQNLATADTERLLELLSQRSQRFLLKLYGDLTQAESAILAPAEYRDLVRRDAAFARFTEGIFFSRTLLFLGVSLEGLEDYLSAFTFPSGVPRPHFALVAVVGADWEARAEVLSRRYNVKVLPFLADDHFAVVDEFLEELLEHVQRLEPSTRPIRASGPPLRKVVLENIGPFGHLELDLHDEWMVLLGDNGVGKSTILKAIAVAIMGSEARHFAGALLKVGQSLGSVRLETEQNPQGYVAEIQRVGTAAEVVSHSGRPLEAEGWLALGFPALRATSWKAVQGPQGVGVRRPSAEDLLPIVTGTPDTRLDDLKQWLINTEALSRREGAAPEDRERASIILARFFEVVRELTDRSVDGLVEISPDYRVMVRTADGEVPIEALSQGMTSLLSWVGILLQRQYEMHTDRTHASDPTQEPALVLMDELDAHMHPLWQRGLVGKLKRIFPTVQMIVSTHSPLIVGGMPIEQITRLARDDAGNVIVARVDQDMTIGRADQLLSGDLFGLPTTLALDDETSTQMVEYRSLLAKSEKTEGERLRFHFLHRSLAERIPPTPESKLERRAHELAMAVLQADFEPNGIESLHASLLAKVRAVGDSMGWTEPVPEVEQ